MDLREKIAEALYEPPTGASGMSKLLAEDAHERRVTAVMGVVEAEHGGEKCVRWGIYEQVCGQMHDAHEEAEAAKARVRALEDENQRMRENVRLKNRAAYLSAINACMARLQGQTDITAVFPALHEMRDRAVELHNAALSRAREIAEEEA